MNPLAPYLDPEARDRQLRALTARHRGEVLEYGRSVEGRPLLAARLPALGGDGARVHRVLASAGIHGPEYVGCAVALGLLARADLPSVLRLRQRAEIWVIPCINPDGYARVWSRGG